jgi:hypothetical protein
VIWLAWRQFRTQAYVVAGVLALIAVAYALTGPSLVHVYDTSVLTCKAHGDCSSVLANFAARDHLLRDLALAVILVPALLGLFWGAPLIAREMENGTFRMAWTQSVTRSRWITTKLCLVGLACVAVAGLFSLMITWWSSPFDTINNNLYSYFDLRDIVPVGYAAFSFSLGVTMGVLIRRTLPAMVATLVAFTAVRAAFTMWVRPHLLSPLHFKGPFNLNQGGGIEVPGRGQSRDWVISSLTLNKNGVVIGTNGGIGPNDEINFHPGAHGGTVLQGVGTCPTAIPPPTSTGRGVSNGQPSPAVQHAVQKCINSFHMKEVLTYLPASRYWTLQWYELALFIVMALLLSAFAWWWVRRRLA